MVAATKTSTTNTNLLRCSNPGVVCYFGWNHGNITVEGWKIQPTTKEFAMLQDQHQLLLLLPPPPLIQSKQINKQANKRRRIHLSRYFSCFQVCSCNQAAINWDIATYKASIRTRTTTRLQLELTRAKRLVTGFFQCTFNGHNKHSYT